MMVSIKCKNGHSYERKVKELFRFVKGGKKHIKFCPECPEQKPTQSQTWNIVINGKEYNSITKCCRELDICKSYLYRKMRQKNIDTTITTNIQKAIEEYINDREK